MKRMRLFRNWIWLKWAAGSTLLFVALPAAGQEIILPIDSLDLEVILRWTKVPGDTFTVQERRRIEQVAFFAFRSQGYLPNSFSSGSNLVGRGVLVPTTESLTSVLEVGNTGDLYLAASPPPCPRRRRDCATTRS